MAKVPAGNNPHFVLEDRALERGGEAGEVRGFESEDVVEELLSLLVALEKGVFLVHATVKKKKLISVS